MADADVYSSGMLRLYTFAISHFSEKARWALDFAGVPFEERVLVPGPHLLVTRRIAPRGTVPILDDHGTIIQGSGAIVDHVQTKLGGAQLAVPAGTEDAAADIEARTDRAFGLGIQRIFYDVLLNHRGLVVDLWSQHGPWWGKPFYALSYPVMARGTRNLYKIRPDKVSEAKDNFRRMFDETDRLISSRPYFGGDAPHRTDIAVASLLAPMVRPAEHKVKWPEFPDEAKPFVAEFEGRPTWKFVEGMYQHHRASSHPRPAV